MAAAAAAALSPAAQVLAASNSNGSVYISRDSGANWFMHRPPSTVNYTQSSAKPRVKLSGDGNTLVLG